MKSFLQSAEQPHSSVTPPPPKKGLASTAESKGTELKKTMNEYLAEGLA
jgi:hypothetical protein